MADPFLVSAATDDLPALAVEEREALIQVGEAGGRIANRELAQGVLVGLLQAQVVSPYAPGAVQLTGLGIRALTTMAKVTRDA